MLSENNFANMSKCCSPLHRRNLVGLVRMYQINPKWEPELHAFLSDHQPNQNRSLISKCQFWKELQGLALTSRHQTALKLKLSFCHQGIDINTLIKVELSSVQGIFDLISTDLRLNLSIWSKHFSY